MSLAYSMINLLPPKEKKFLQDEEKKKTVLILGILGFVFFLCLALILTSMKIYISGQAEAENIIIEREKEAFKASEIKDFSEEIKLANKVFSDLNSFYQNQVKLIEILEEITQIFPEEIYLTNFSYKKETSEVVLFGFSKTRETLLEFKKNLEQKENIEGVYFPPSCWLESTDINFNTRFKIKR